VDGFDETRGFAFSTYAVPVILGEIRSIFRQGGAIKISRAMKEKGIEALRECELFASVNGREPTVSELSEKLGISAEETAQVLACNLPVMSLTTPEGEEFEVSVNSPEDELSDNIAVAQAIKSLSGEEQKIIRLRYFKEYTQSQTAEALGISQVQVSRKERKILIKLRHILE
jgi:RNA polymerase sporulation-specific sigma factor